jgi:deoxyribodipyrimidine photolyase-related protein
MANFYKTQRIKYNLLIDDDNKPVGGKWSFDSENRKKLPKNIEIPENIIFKETFHTKELKNEVNQKFTENPGDTGDFWLGTTRKNALESLDHFIKFKLNLFGDYEDAVDQRNNILFHSALSPYINLGLITPSEILLKLKSISKETSINSLEGYIRQVVGWREFIRGIYQNYSEELESKNFFNNKRKMKESWYTGNTGIPPLDYSIKNALKYGWSHHIERLMILSNIMNLSGINPKEVYRWFMEMFVDSSEWVMTPNVYGMGLFSDGGIFATKPYICGSAYFLKMMDFKKGDWCHTMDGLYWNFINKNRNFFLKNPRLSMMVRILDKMSKERKDKIFKAANEFIDKNTED